MAQVDPNSIFISDCVADDFHVPVEVNRIPHVMSDFPYDIKFSDDCFVCLHEGYTVTYACLQLAVYMGFAEIYLLGVDCNYTGTNDHAFDFKVSEETSLAQLNQGELMQLRMTTAYKAAKKYADAHGVKIFNATRGGKLEVFPRVSLEEALKD